MAPWDFNWSDLIESGHAPPAHASAFGTGSGRSSAGDPSGPVGLEETLHHGSADVELRLRDARRIRLFGGGFCFSSGLFLFRYFFFWLAHSCQGCLANTTLTFNQTVLAPHIAHKLLFLS